MVTTDIPYYLDAGFVAPAFRFQSIWKVGVNDSYQASQPQGFMSAGLFVTYEGKGSIMYGDTSETMEAGTWLLVSGDVPCSYRCLDGDWKFYFLHFDPLDVAELLGLAAWRPVSTGRMSDAVRLCERLIDSLILQPAGYGMAVHLTSQELLHLFAQERAAYGRSRHPELDDILYRMHKQIGASVPVDEYVRLSGLSRTAFYTRFRERTGMSPTQYVQELKLASAKATLETTNATVKEIAASLRFYDEFHFSRLFKRRYGLAPSAYRRGL